MMRRMRIVADANIAYVLDAFGPLGEVVTLPSAELTAAAVREADIVTTVTASAQRPLRTLPALTPKLPKPPRSAG